MKSESGVVFSQRRMADDWREVNVAFKSAPCYRLVVDKAFPESHAISCWEREQCFSRRKLYSDFYRMSAVALHQFAYADEIYFMTKVGGGAYLKCLGEFEGRQSWMRSEKEDLLLALAVIAWLTSSRDELRKLISIPFVDQQKPSLNRPFLLIGRQIVLEL